MLWRGHLIALAACYALRASALDVRIADQGQFPITEPPGWGYSLPLVYLVWATVVVTLYPLCRWFAVEAAAE